MVSDEALDEVRSRGFTVVEGSLRGQELVEAQAAFADVFPTHETFFADPESHAELVSHQFGGNWKFPFHSWRLNRLAYHPELVSAAERFCETTDLLLYKVEAWAKYSGGADYNQPPHRDFSNHNLLVPRADFRWPQMTTFLLLSDVGESDGPTMIVPRPVTQNVPLSTSIISTKDFAADEVPLIGPAGTLLIYTTDVVHRGSSMTGHPASRFAFLADYMGRDAPWLGRRAWPDSGNAPAWQEIFGRATPRELALFGVPAPGHEYWNEQTITDVGVRYPAMDMSPYRSAMGSSGPTTPQG